MTDEPPHMPTNLAPDSIAERLEGASSDIPEGYVSFKGYVAPENHGLHRLYSDDSFQRWLAVNPQDIVAQISVPPNDRDTRSVIYIRREARVIMCQVSKAYEVDSGGNERLDVSRSTTGGLPATHPPWTDPGT